MELALPLRVMAEVVADTEALLVVDDEVLCDFVVVAELALVRDAAEPVDVEELVGVEEVDESVTVVDKLPLSVEDVVAAAVAEAEVEDWPGKAL